MVDPKLPEQLKELSQNDYKFAADAIWQEFNRRKNNRAELDSVWDMIDQQVAMRYEMPPIDRESGRGKGETAWLPAVEPPWQIQGLEILVGDTDRMLFPPLGNHFNVMCDASDELLAVYEERMAQQKGALGSANAELVNETVTALHNTYQGIYGHRSQWKRMFSQAFLYGTMFGRMMPTMLPSKAGWWDGQGWNSDILVPMLTCMPTRQVYIDDSYSAARRLGYSLGPALIYEYKQKLADLRIAANSMPKIASNILGGWLPEQLVGLESDRQGEITVLEWSGDFLFERGYGKPLYLENAIITVASGAVSMSPAGPVRIIRIRTPKFPFSTYLEQPYLLTRSDQLEDYGTGPLMMGRTIQKAGSVALNRWLASIILNAEPPLRFDKNDPAFANSGGPIIAPRALWGAESPVEAVQIGEPAVLGAAVAQLDSSYRETVGTIAPRLGQQTKSHQTAFAVDVENLRSQARTVTFGQTISEELMPRQLQMEYWMIREYLPKKGLRVMLPITKEYITVTKDMLPEFVNYEVAGANDPVLEQQRAQQKLVALQQVGAVEQIRVQLGQPPQINWTAIQREILKEGGFQDVDAILSPQQRPDLTPGLLPPAGTTGGVPGAAEGATDVSGIATQIPTETALRLAAGSGGP